jgi:hypothetical protein
MPDPGQAAFPKDPEIGHDIFERYGIPLPGRRARLLGHSP